MKGKSTSLGMLFLGLLSCNQQERGGTGYQEPEEVLVVEVEEPELFTGRLYTSGLTEREVEALQLSEPVFQLTGNPGYYISGSDSLRDYLGACLAVKGFVKEDWEQHPESLNGQTTYGRSALEVEEVEEVEVLEGSACDGAYLPEQELPAADEVSEYRGSLRRMERPAPDIAYDYMLVLNEPLQMEYDPVLPGRLVKDLPLVLFDAAQVEAAEEALAHNQGVLVHGRMVQAYAEGKALEVRDIEFGG